MHRVLKPENVILTSQLLVAALVCAEQYCKNPRLTFPVSRGPLAPGVLDKGADKILFVRSPTVLIVQRSIGGPMSIELILNPQVPDYDLLQNELREEPARSRC